MSNTEATKTTQTAWQAMGYSWRDGEGMTTVARSLAMVDPFHRACSPAHTLERVGRTIAHVGGQ